MFDTHILINRLTITIIITTPPLQLKEKKKRELTLVPFKD